MRNKFISSCLAIFCLSVFMGTSVYANKPPTDPPDPPKTEPVSNPNPPTITSSENENESDDCPCDGDSCEDEAKNDCLSYKIAFGRALNAPELGSGNFIIYLQEPAPTLATPGKLFYDYPLLYSYSYPYSGVKY